MIVPALLAVGVLANAWRAYPRPADLEVIGVPWPREGRMFPRVFWVYLAAAAAIAAGYADFPLIAYHFGARHVISPEWVPVLYAVAMGVDALAATSLASLRPVRAFCTHRLDRGSRPRSRCWSSAATSQGGRRDGIWGAGMGAQESILRATIATMVPAERRAHRLRAVQRGYGLAWFLGSAVLGYLYDVSFAGLIAFSVLAQVAAFALIVCVARQAGIGRRAGVGFPT